MTDAVIMVSGEVLTAPRISLTPQGWVEHNDRDGGTVAATPPQRVEQILFDIEQFDLEEYDLDLEPDEEASDEPA